MPWTIETISKIVSRTTTPIHVMTDQNSKSASLTNLEEKISFLERHIEEQDREIYNQAEQLQRITQKLTLLQIPGANLFKEF